MAFPQFQIAYWLISKLRTKGLRGILHFNVVYAENGHSELKFSSCIVQYKAEV